VVGLCIDEGLTQLLQGCRARKSPLSRPEAHADDVRQVMFDHVLHGVHHLRETLDAQDFGGGRGNQDDVGFGRDGVCPLHVE
jgi:hypothetical protein